MAILCSWIRRQLTAQADGELSGVAARSVRFHLARCRACAAECSALERSVAEQRKLLRAVAGGADIDADHLWSGVRRRLAAEPPQGAVRKPTVRIVLACAGAAAVFLVAARLLDPVWISIGLEKPPRKLAEEPELFIDYSLFEHLETIENLDRPARSPASGPEVRSRG